MLSDERIAELANQATLFKEYLQRDELRKQAESAIRIAVREAAEEAARIVTAESDREAQEGDMAMAVILEQCAVAIRARIEVSDAP